MASCDNCMWREQCLSNEVCKHYNPVNEDEYIDEMVGEGRYEFRKEWFSYSGKSE